MRIGMISDTHGLHQKIKIQPCDILIHAGDMEADKIQYLKEFVAWFRDQPAKYKVCIGGNHDWVLEAFMKEDAEEILRHDIMKDIHYLRDSAVTIEGVKIYGSPWQPFFMSWAFNLPPGSKLKAKWDMIPNDTDVLITHGPPMGQRDWVGRQSVGCYDLKVAVERVNPEIHVFGHTHHGYGLTWQGGQSTKFYNASQVNKGYQLVHDPIYAEIDRQIVPAVIY